MYFYSNKQFYFRQFSLGWVQFNCQKTFQFQAIQFSHTVLIQPIHLSIDFVYIVKCQNSTKLNNLV